MEESNAGPDKDPIIGVRLSVLLGACLGYREKCAPHKEIVEAIKKVPPDIAKLHCHIQDSNDGSVPWIWSAIDWKNIGERDAELRVASAKFNYSKDSLFEWLITNVPFFAADKNFTSVIVNQVVTTGIFDTFKVFGLTDEQIEAMKGENKST